MRLHGIVLDSEVGHLYLYLLQISATVTFNAHVRTDALCISQRGLRKRGWCYGVVDGISSGEDTIVTEPELLSC